jgi:hypothetical protein
MADDTSGTESAHRAVRRQVRAYRAGSDQPFVGYAATAASYAGLVVAGTLLARRSGAREAAATVGSWDLAPMGLTTHKLSRLLAKDAVTSPMRAFFAPFPWGVRTGRTR